MSTTRVAPRRPALPAYVPFGTPIGREMEEMRNRMRHLFPLPLDEMFTAPFGTELLTEPVGWNPSVDVLETADEFVITAELPGLSAKDVTIELQNDALTLKGEKVAEKKEEKEQVHLWERTYGRFQRTFTFPMAVVGDKIAAEFVNGVLKIRVPKAPEVKAKIRKIEVAEKK